MVKVNMRYIVPITSYTWLSDESGLPQVDSYGGPGELIHTASLTTRSKRWGGWESEYDRIHVIGD